MVKHYLHIVRPINLILVAISQVLIYYTFIIPTFSVNNITPHLSNHLIWLFILDTVLISAAGYIINDIKDVNTDQINKPSKSYVGDKKLKMVHAKSYYYIVVIIGAIIAAHIAITISRPLLFLIYPLASIALYIYSDRWKKKPLTGNIVVSVFCAFVPGIIWYAESDGMIELYNFEPYKILLFGSYILFGFFATFTREIIKDIEDEKGDRLAGYRTFPIIAGISRAKHIAITNLMATLGSFVLWLWSLWQMNNILGLLITTLFLISPTLYLIVKTSRASMKKEYSYISRIIKILLGISLIIFLITISQI